MALSDPKAFEQALNAAAMATDKALDALLPQSGRLADAMRYAALGTGKKLRPFLVIETAKLYDTAGLDAMRVAAAIECIHCYSLVHDDLPAMDNDDLRRGRPTLHKAFDEATAILAGDALQALAFAILADEKTHPDGTVRALLVAALAKAAGAAGMVGGQMLDIEAESRNFASLAEISAMQSGKTGALFRFACTAAAIGARADATVMQRFADCIGLAFQIADDILDVESNAAALGKATQKDKANGKATFVDFLGMDGARLEAQRLTAQAISSLDIFDARSSVLAAAAHYVITRKK